MRIEGRRAISLLFAALCVFALSGCATAPVEETRAFDKAVTAIKTAGDALFDEFAASQRRTHVARVKAKKGQYYFSLEDAAYFATQGEPKDVATYRNALAIVKSYSTLLLSLAEGDSVGKTQADILAVAKSIGSIASASSFFPAAQALTQVLDQALRAYSAAEARRLAMNGIPVIQDIISELQATAPTIFKGLLADRSMAGAASSVIDADRVMVSNFVMLLESLRATLEALKFAYLQPSQAATFALLIETSTKLVADVDAAKKAYIIVRGGK